MARVPNPSRSSFSIARSHRGWVMSDPEADETRLEMAHRHVREAEQHIALQEALIGRMELNGEDVLAAIGRTLLEDSTTIPPRGPRSCRAPPGPPALIWTGLKRTSALWSLRRLDIVRSLGVAVACRLRNRTAILWPPFLQTD